ncbi:transposable element Tcb1 transposase [Trichonephila clavipes]|nr:transposable element Tcb1 transposase [Trichonephila clavipes]
MANNQSVRRHLDAFTRGRIIGKLEEGRSVGQICGCRVRIAHSIVSRLWNNFKLQEQLSGGSVVVVHEGTTPADDRYIVLQARRNRRQTAGEIARHTTHTGDWTTDIAFYRGQKTARWWSVCHDAPVRCVPLTSAHRRRRSLWCRKHRNWRDNEWGTSTLTDEQIQFE